MPVSGGGYFRILPYWLTRAGLEQINQRRGRPFAFYLHPWELDPGQPRIKVGAFSRFRHYTNLSRCEARLRRVLGEFAFTSMYEACSSAASWPPSRAATRQRPPLAPAPLVPGASAGRLIAHHEAAAVALAAPMLPPCSADRARRDRKSQPLARRRCDARAPHPTR